jgi:hypothetical protein
MRTRFLIPLTIAFGFASTAQASTRTDIPGPPGSYNFGKTIHVLPNGNFVVTDPDFDFDGQTSVGAVYLYKQGGQLISRITGSSSADQVGSGGITILANGNFVIISPDWSNQGVDDAGAVTWVNGVTGLSGTVSTANSLVGTATDDFSGTSITALTNGNYVVISPHWDNAGTIYVGAVTWGSGTTGVTGHVTAANSLIGTSEYDQVGFGGVTALANGNYVVRSQRWSARRGAVTWADGTTGVTGPVSAANSLVGSTINDEVGTDLTSLANGNYVVRCPNWDNAGIVDAGAVTWANGTTGITGFITTANSLVGSSPGDRIGLTGIDELANGHFVIRSYRWDNGGVTDAGAAT